VNYECCGRPLNREFDCSASYRRRPGSVWARFSVWGAAVEACLSWVVNQLGHRSARTQRGLISFKADVEARKAVSEVGYHFHPENIFYYHTLTVGFLCWAFAYCWIALGQERNSDIETTLNWSVSFAAHDAGLVFGYIYYLKGRVLGFHKLRMGALRVLVSGLMLVSSFPVIASLTSNPVVALNATPSLDLIATAQAVVAVAMLVGLSVFERQSVYPLPNRGKPISTSELPAGGC
jgi:hypothetical protein